VISKHLKAPLTLANINVDDSMLKRGLRNTEPHMDFKEGSYYSPKRTFLLICNLLKIHEQASGLLGKKYSKHKKTIYFFV